MAYAREALVSFGFGDVARFDAQAKRSLERYEEILHGEILCKHEVGVRLASLASDTP